jgi:alpha-L-rhamnosidase
VLLMAAFFCKLLLGNEWGSCYFRANLKDEMKMKLFFSVLLLLLSPASWAQLSVSTLKTENRVNPVGLDDTQPYLSWVLNDTRRNARQTAYEVRVGTDAAALLRGQALVWASGKVASDQSVHVPYQGETLKSGRRYFWQVRVWDHFNKPSQWSPVAFWQMGLLQESDWAAKWIVPGYAEDTVLRPSPFFRKELTLPKPIRSASAYITAHGVYEAVINGQRVGDAYLTPGWTSYKNRLQYQVYDVTRLLKTGNNAIGVALGSGWFRGTLAWEDGRNHYGKHIALLMQVEVTYTDGSRELIVTDGNWKSNTGPVLSSEIYDGEVYDARLEKAGWASPGFDDAGWYAAHEENFPKSNLIATYNEPIRKRESLKPVRIFQTPKGETVADFGQNMVGFVEVKVRGNAGDRIAITHAEVLDKFGNFYTENLRAAKQENVFILKGSGVETFAPKFTFQGFRYIKIEGFPGTPTADAFTAHALYSDMPLTGTFKTSDPLINQLQQNIQWGQRGNFLDVPTDCPQRDERLGWTGDAQAFARTAAYNFDVYNFFVKWMKDLAADQLENGAVPPVIPNVLGDMALGSAGWADAANIIPWDMYRVYGDRRILENQYESMKKWVGFIQQTAKNNLWNTGFHFGDWLFYRPNDDTDGRAAVTDKYLIAQCFYANSVQMLIHAARVLGKPEDVAKYENLLKVVKEAFMKEYMTANGRLVSGTQTAYVLALHFDMLPENLRAQAAERLVENIRSYNTHLTTGFLGTPYLCHVLSRFGHEKVAFELLMQQKYPSWLYPVTMGATTIWERWDGIKPDSTFQNAGMNSFNHYAYGAIGDWMYRNITGLDTDPEVPGYKQMVIRPVPGGGLTSAEAELKTYYGRVFSGWKKDGNRFTMQVVIPANTSASVFVPAAKDAEVLEGGKPLSALKEIAVLGRTNTHVQLRLGAGQYQFSTIVP